MILFYVSEYRKFCASYKHQSLKLGKLSVCSQGFFSSQVISVKPFTVQICKYYKASKYSNTTIYFKEGPERFPEDVRENL